MLRILIVPHEPAAKIRTRAGELSRAFIELGHSVDIFGLDLQPKSLSKLEKAGWHLKSLIRGLRREKLGERFHRVTLPYLARGPKVLRDLVLRWNQKILEEQGYDFVLNAAYAAFSPPREKTKVIYDLIDDHAKGYEVAGETAYVSEIRDYMADEIRRADAVAASSYVLVEMAKTRYQREAKFAPNGANLEEIRHASGKTVPGRIGYIGSLDSWVDLRTLIDSVALLRQKNPKVSLFVVGAGSATEGLEIPDWVEMAGFVEPDKVPELLSTFHIGVVPFELSPFTDAALPLKVIEYGAAKKLTVSTALEELRKQRFPWVSLAELNADDFAEKMALAMEQDWQGDWDSQVEPFSWRNSAKSLIEAYEEII